MPFRCSQRIAVQRTASIEKRRRDPVRLDGRSRDCLYDIGLPGKSGIGGGIVTVPAPGKGGLGTFSPLLHGAGNSVRSQLVASFLSHRLGLGLFASKPAA